MAVGSRRDHIRALLVASDADDSVRFPDHLDKGSNALRNDQGASAEVRGAPGGWPPRGDKLGRLTHCSNRSIHWFHIFSPIRQSARLRGDVAAMWRTGKSRRAISRINLRRIAGTNSDTFRIGMVNAPVPPITQS